MMRINYNLLTKAMGELSTALLRVTLNTGILRGAVLEVGDPDPSTGMRQLSVVSRRDSVDLQASATVRDDVWDHTTRVDITATRHDGVAADALILRATTIVEQDAARARLAEFR